MAKSNLEIINKGYSNIPSGLKTALYIGIAAGGVYIAYRIYKNFSADAQREREQTKDIENELSDSIKAKPLTYPKSQYSGFADTIQTAGFDAGTDEQAIYSVFYKLKNDSDYLALTAAWGKPTRTIYDWGMAYKMTLPQFLRWEMSDTEVQKINKILASKNIKYRV